MLLQSGRMLGLLILPTFKFSVLVCKIKPDECSFTDLPPLMESPDKFLSLALNILCSIGIRPEFVVLCLSLLSSYCYRSVPGP